ncbi:MAG: ATP-binding protein [Brevinematia bacterium]
MKIRFFVILFLLTVVILGLSIYTSYISIYNHQKLLEKELWKIGKIAENNIELQKRVALFKVFSENMVVETTRKVWFAFLLNIFIIVIIFAVYTYGVRKPISFLSRQVKSIYFEKSLPDLKIKEMGTEEIRVLIRAFNEMLEKLKRYEEVIGNVQKYRGWKEISRVLVHEINNLLSPIQTYAEYLIDGTNDKKKVGLILTKISEIKEILNRLREFSHFPDPVLQKYEVTGILKELSSEFKDVSLESSKQVYLCIDPLLFKETIRNIIKNAIESGEDVSVRISVNIESDMARITIKDNGPGISESNIEKIFSPGFSTKKNKGNIGIGLSIVQSLIQEQKGRIAVESKEGEGTSFHLIFPLMEVADGNTCG